jgi:hypothetical protein
MKSNLPSIFKARKHSDENFEILMILYIFII